MSKPSLREIIGDPKRINAELQQFREDAKLLSSQRMNFLAKYPKQWIAVYKGQVQADAPSLDQLLARLDDLQIPRQETVVQYRDQNLRRMIL